MLGGERDAGDAEVEVVEVESTEPVMPSPPPFPVFQNTPTLPHQLPGNGFESGRDSRAR